jgi:hypothetical protein
VQKQLARLELPSSAAGLKIDEVIESSTEVID